MDSASIKEYRVAGIREIGEKRGFLTKIEGEEVSLFKIDGTLFAIGNVCPHQHFSRLHEGELNGFELTCPMHGWTYDLRTGFSTNASGRVRTYEVVIKRDEVFVRTHGDAD